MNVVLANRQRTRSLNPHLLKQIASALLVDLKIEDAELGVHLIATPEMTRLNERFLRHEGSTDVITFDYSDAGRRAPAARQQLYGEIFICVDEAVLQAHRYGTSWQLEILRYLVHGVLHLLGHDDSHTGERRKMKREEDRRVRELSRRFSLAQPGRTAKLSSCKNR
ncbi:MAG TPA: rRNA maturation RNase YbeY [Verrucomicrobiae bacterium]|nr:rRNA maturation RNase YbeY [Verrucomicrobiae bacterium]